MTAASNPAAELTEAEECLRIARRDPAKRDEQWHRDDGGKLPVVGLEGQPDPQGRREDCRVCPPDAAPAPTVDQGGEGK